MINNIFVHDAVPTWSGFVYQGQIAVYLAVKKICELDAADKKEEMNCYAIEMEKCEDIAVVYEKKGYKKYESIHQVKNYEKQGIGEYKSPLTQLMLEKGFCQKNGYDVPDAYLHVSRAVLLKVGETFEHKMQEWQMEIIHFYESLCKIQKELEQNGDIDDILARLKECINKQPIKFNRSEYKNILEKVDSACEKKDLHEAKEKLTGLLEFLEQELCVPQINKDVEIYSYDDSNSKKYCTGTEVFKNIVDYVTKYKCNKGMFCKEQYEYIADKMLSFVEGKILERHQLMQEGGKASSRIPFSEFVKILDEGIERYDEEANFLALTRIYNQRMEEYCNICENKEECLGENCRLQQEDSRRNFLEKEVFVRLCYNLNPECEETMKDRVCLSELLDGNGMLDSVLPSIKDIPGEYFVEQGDKSRFEVMNHGKVAFLTAISNRHGSLVVKKIEKALSVNQNLIVNVFEADQLVTVQLEESSSIWDNSCVKIRKDDLQASEDGEDDEEHSIYVAKKPEFIKAEHLIREIGTR